MTIWLPRLDKHRGPRYLAIADAIADDVASGQLKPGSRLPTHRDLADRLGVTVGTVSRGYVEAARRGLLSGEVGRGTFVRYRGTEVTPPPRGDLGRPKPVDLSQNLPPPAMDEPHLRSLQDTLRSLASRADLAALLDYPAEAGNPPDREAGAAWIARTGLPALPEQVLVCGGGQHGLTTVLATLLTPGDLVLTEALTFPGLKAAANLLHLRLQGLPLDDHGLRADAFAAACQSTGAKALYCVPTIQNPTGAVMPAERRREIASIAEAHRVAIVEDDLHALLPRERPLPLAALAPDISYYVTSMSKTLAPGLRIGYVLAPAAMVGRLAANLRATTWASAPLMAAICSAWIREGTADTILEARRREAAARQTLARAILGGSEYRAHPYAYHLWLSLPEPWRSDSFVAQARIRGVAVTPAEAFVVGRSSVPHAVRLCLGAARDRAELEKGLRLVAATLEGSPDAGSPIV
ncbi:MAG TPA: PLP-dependent aminotransferase family protein [Vicinamibacteria bacterium]|nr:PLP-dependent aminotransferase family protein [Vicinamibacteria bacterium]